MHRLILLTVAAIFLTTAVADATEKGWFGFTATVAADSMFSLDPTIRAIKISSVERDSPAARAGLAAGDEVLELEHVQVAGHKANELRPLMQKSVGETLHLRLKHGDGREYSAALIAAAKR